MSVEKAMKILADEVGSDDEYAWSWHCNVAMACLDAGGSTHKQANEAAARFMFIAFGVDTSNSPYYRQLFESGVVQ